MSTFSLVATLLLTLQLPAQEAPRASIEGAVVRAGSSEPIEQAQITLTRVASPGTAPAPALPPQAPTGPPLPSIRTDREGKFALKDLAPGSYRLAVARNNYIGQEYGQRSQGRPGTVIELVAGQALKDVVFRLTPSATVSGRVSSASGEPLPGIAVQLLRSVYDANGKRTLQNAKAAVTDDRGEYRLYFLNPGRYFINASPPPDTSAQRALVQTVATAQTGGNLSPAQQEALNAMLAAPPATTETLEAGYAPTYYPGTADPSQGSSIELQAGADLRGIDLRLIKQQGFRVRGRVIDAKTGQPPSSPIVQVVPRNTIAVARAFPATMDSNTGSFELRDIPPGAYTVVAIVLPSNLGQATLGALTSSISGAMAQVDVSGSDIDNLVLTIAPGVIIPGRLSIDGAASISAVQGFDKMGIGLVPIAEPAITAPRALSIAADGTFTLDNVAPGEYRINVSGIPPTAYVKSARLGPNDALLGTLSVTDRVSGTLDIVIGQNAGEITGTVVDKDLKPMRNVQAVLIPDRLRDRRDLYKAVATDESGRFTIRGLSPGDYKLFAWEDLERFAYYDPDVLRQYEQQGKGVSVSEASKVQVELKAIPAQ